jgi:hypothetical protein
MLSIVASVRDFCLASVRDNSNIPDNKYGN